MNTSCEVHNQSRHNSGTIVLRHMKLRSIELVNRLHHLLLLSLISSKQHPIPTLRVLSERAIEPLSLESIGSIVPRGGRRSLIPRGLRCADSRHEDLIFDSTWILVDLDRRTDSDFGEMSIVSPSTGLRHTSQLGQTDGMVRNRNNNRPKAKDDGETAAFWFWTRVFLSKRQTVQKGA